MCTTNPFTQFNEYLTKLLLLLKVLFIYIFIHLFIFTIHNFSISFFICFAHACSARFDFTSNWFIANPNHSHFNKYYFSLYIHIHIYTIYILYTWVLEHKNVIKLERKFSFFYTLNQKKCICIVSKLVSNKRQENIKRSRKSRKSRRRGKTSLECFECIFTALNNCLWSFSSNSLCRTQSSNFKSSSLSESK